MTHHSPVTDRLLVRRHHLPHWQLGGSVYFVTFRSARGELPAEAMRQVIVHVLHDHGHRYGLYFGVVMPDHVHLLLQPLANGPASWYDLATILKGIKGTSARRINQLLGMEGAVWQAENFDRIVRSEQEYEEKLAYMYHNPVKAGLVTAPEEYPYFAIPAGRRGTPAPPR